MSEPREEDITQEEQERGAWSVRWPDLIDDPEPDPEAEKEIEELINWQEPDEEPSPEAEDEAGS